MNRTQLFLSVGGVLLTVLLFQLPRSVVENEQLQEVASTSEHSLQIPESVQAEMVQLRRSLKQAGNSDKKTNFAHSLAKRFLDYGVLDSAISYAKAIEGWENRPSEQAADIYFTAFERSASSEKGIQYAENARAILGQLLDKDPDNLFLKNRLAMTLVASENPMAGISMLQEILDQDETNRQAILNLGLLAIQSSQFERAKERFETLVSLNRGDHEAKLYLAVSLIEINQQAQARLLLEEILATQDSIPAIKVMANDYLKLL